MERISTQRSLAAKQGFAIVIALMLMAFLALLTLSLSSTTTVETRTADITQQRDDARQHAMLGLQTAIGQLETHAVNDQRVSSTADLLGSSHPTKARYTTIWDADPKSPTFEQPLTLLASQRNAGNPRDDAATAVDSRFAIELVGSRRVGLPDAVLPVEAELLEVENSEGFLTGEFAWWVGDEGVKARAKPR